MRKIIFIACIILGASGLCSQSDSIYFDKEILITESPFRQSETGSHVQNWDAEDINNIQAQSLAQLLSTTENIYIKSYGPGILSTSSLRGGQSGHTLVLWNGLPIQSPLVGQLDFSLLNLSNIDKVTIQRGGQSSMWGSGAIGGVISLENRSGIENEFLASVSAGAFGYTEGGLSADYSMGDISFKSSINHRYSDNDFSFKSGSNTKLLQNARQEQTDINQDIYFDINKATNISLHYWGVIADRQIPPTANQSFSDARQKDDIHRTSLMLRHIMKKKVLNLRMAYFDESLLYEEAALNLNSKTGFKSAIADMSIEGKQLANLSWIAGLNFISNAIKDSPRYPVGADEQRIAMFLGMSWQTGSLKLNTSVRQEMLDGQLLNPLPSIAAEYSLNPQFRVKAKVSRNFRYPSLNDRYWIPGGNQELQSETGWSMEAGTEYVFEHKSYSGNISITGFNRRIDNWIQWSLDADTRLWSAFNLNEVWSRGLEFKAHVERSVNNLSLSLDGGIDYIKSTSQKSIALPKIEKGEQIWYTPQHSGFMSLESRFSKVSIQYFHKWTSETRGINAMLRSYDTGLLYASLEWSLANCSIKSWVSVNNIWNESYRIIEFRPMPGRQLVMGLVFKFKKSNK